MGDVHVLPVQPTVHKTLALAVKQGGLVRNDVNSSTP
jgi:hypothetical protein